MSKKSDVEIEYERRVHGQREGDDVDTNKDIDSFKAVQDKALKIFLERREKYGSHLENSKRFKKEHVFGLYLKCVRMVRMIENDKPIDLDTLIDLSVYGNLVYSQTEDNV